MVHKSEQSMEHKLSGLTSLFRIEMANNYKAFSSVYRTRNHCIQFCIYMEMEARKWKLCL